MVVVVMVVTMLNTAVFYSHLTKTFVPMIKCVLP